MWGRPPSGACPERSRRVQSKRIEVRLDYERRLSLFRTPTALNVISLATLFV